MIPWRKSVKWSKIKTKKKKETKKKKKKIKQQKKKKKKIAVNVISQGRESLTCTCLARAFWSEKSLFFRLDQQKKLPGCGYVCYDFF